MYRNLKEFMKESQIYQRHLAGALDLSENRVNYRMRTNGFKCREMQKIRDTFFPEMSLDDLFKWEE